MSKSTRSAAYPNAFYEARSSGSSRSADAVLDVLASLGLGPWSRVIDVGCGRGDWLNACVRRGATTAVGIDGAWNAGAFEPPSPVQFRSCELERASRASLVSRAGDDRFDLAISVETLEHLPPEAGAAVIEALVSWSDLVVFSAAIPGQGGRDHQNEQWQSHWAAEFAKHGYAPYDIVRPALWERSDVESWYRENILVYAPAPPIPGLQHAPAGFIDLVHPEVFARRRFELSGAELARATRGLLRRRLQGLRRRFGS